MSIQHHVEVFKVIFCFLMDGYRGFVQYAVVLLLYRGTVIAVRLSSPSLVTHIIIHLLWTWCTVVFPSGHSLPKIKETCSFPEETSTEYTNILSPFWCRKRPFPRYVRPPDDAYNKGSLLCLRQTFLNLILVLLSALMSTCLRIHPMFRTARIEPLGDPTGTPQIQ